MTDEKTSAAWRAHDEKISAAWRAHDDADAEMMEIDRLAKIARDSGAQADADPVVSMWRKILGTVRSAKRKR